MTSRLLSRFSRALFALWFVAMVGDTGALHACAMHGGKGHQHGGMPAAGMAEHVAHQGASASHDASPHGRAPICTCLGECCSVTVVVPVTGASEVNVATVVAVPDHPLDLVERVTPATAGLRLPFANGPPTA